jgi:RNase H-fold protein (predicted Holliday junction resolvase)
MFDYVAIDWGSKKCGIALGDSTTSLVTPKAIVVTEKLLSYLSDLVATKKQLTTCVISENKTFAGKDTHNSNQSLQLSKIIEEQLPSLKCILYNERGTTSPYGKNQDQYAASQLLAFYFRYVLAKP